MGWIILTLIVGFLIVLIGALLFMAFVDMYDDIMRVLDDLKERRKERKLTEFQKNSEKEVE